VLRVAIEERVNRLELGVGQSHLHQNRQGIIGMKNPFESTW
jgi:hypothetical protein